MFSLLNGVRVLDFSQYMPDAAGCHLADLGAEVIKVEALPLGSLTRYAGVHPTQHMRNKKSLAMNMKTPEGQAVFWELLKTSHMLIDGLRAGALDGLGLSYEAVSRAKPDIVYISISGWGSSGPYRRLPTHGQGFDAFSGLEPVVWQEGLPRPGHQTVGEMAAIIGCYYAAMAGLAALVPARETGRGTHIEVSEGEAGAWYNFNRFTQILNSQGTSEAADGVEDKRTRYTLYPTKDGQAVYLMASERKFWTNFCRVVDRPDLATRGDWANVMDSGGYEGEYAELVAIFQSKTKAEWMEIFIEHDIAGAPANSLTELLEDEHFKTRDALVEVVDPRGDKKTKILGSPVKVRGEKFVPKSPPHLGEHTDEVLQSIGYDDQRIGALRAKGVVQ